MQSHRIKGTLTQLISVLVFMFLPFRNEISAGTGPSFDHRVEPKPADKVSALCHCFHTNRRTGNTSSAALHASHALSSGVCIIVFRVQDR